MIRHEERAAGESTIDYDEAIGEVIRPGHRGCWRHKGELLLDVSAATLSSNADPSFATVIAPASRASVDADSLSCCRGCGRDGLVAVDANQMTAQIMFAAEGATTRAMRANMRLQTVGIMGRHVSLQIVSSSERSRAIVTLILLARVFFRLVFYAAD